MTGTNTAALGAKSHPKLKKLSLVFLTAMAVLVATTFLLVLLLWSVHLWNVPLWATIALGLLLIPGGSYAIWYWARSFAAGRCRFGLRTCLVGFAFTAIILATVGRSVFEGLSQGYAVQAVVQSGGYPNPWSDKNDNWLEAATGFDPFEDVEVLDVRTNQAIPAILQHKDRLSDLQHLSFSGGPTDACLERASELNSFPRLHSGEFIGMQLTDKGLRHLGEWSNVRNLFFNGCAFTDEGLAHLTALPNLESLTLIGDEGGNMAITDAGMVRIGRLSTLKTLRLVGIPITDAGLAHLMKLQGLQELTVRRTSVTEEGMANLRTVLTDCWATGMKHSFPAKNQIHQIRVCEDGGAEEEIIVIDNPDRIADVTACLDRFVGPTGVRWHREWETDSHGNVRVHFEGSRRRLCSCVVGQDFLRNGRGMYRRLSDAESLEIRDTLGLGDDNQE